MSKSNSNLLLGKYSVTTDAAVRSVTVTFRFGEEVQESTVGERPDYKKWFYRFHIQRVSIMS